MQDGTTDNVAVVTYGYLRAGIVVLVFLLAIAIGIYSAAHGIQESISAYYYTPVRTVFTGVLFAVGIAMIAYSSPLTVEDQLLNVAGVMAFFVATIPTPRPLNPTDAQEVSDSITVGGWSVVTAFGLALVANLVVRRQLLPDGSWARAVGILLVAAVVIFAVVLLRGGSVQALHPVAAVTLFVAIGLVAFINAVAAEQRYKPWYWIAAGGIIASVVVVGLAHLALPNFTQAVFWLEFLPIGFFTLFWAVQTGELLRRVTRSTESIPPVLTR